MSEPARINPFLEIVGRAARAAQPGIEEGLCADCRKPIEGFALKCEPCSERARQQWARERLKVNDDGRWREEERARLIADLDKAKATIPGSHQWATLNSAELPKRVRLPSAIEQAKASLDSRRVILTGPSGGGKTSLACALMRHKVDLGYQEHHRFTPAAKLARGARFMSSKYDLTRARARHRLGDDEAPEVEAAYAAPLLLIDELGVDKNRDDVLSDIIQYRHAKEELWTIVTTPFRSKQLYELYGDGVMRRLLERATTIKCAHFLNEDR